MSGNDRDNESQATNERPPDVEAPELVPVMEGYTEQEDKAKKK
ncbi:MULTISPECIES: hypothetical protein [unclassified Marinobacterium]|jgi:hypothetical protein